MIATGVALKEILNALCLIIEEQRSGTLASVLLLSSDGIHLESVAGPSLPKGWTQQMEKCRLDRVPALAARGVSRIPGYSLRHRD